MTILMILAVAFFCDLFLNGGGGMSSIIKAFHGNNKQPKTELEILNSKVSEINDELDYLQDELNEAIDEEDETTEVRIREKIITRKQILRVYLDKLGKVNEN